MRYSISDYSRTAAGKGWGRGWPTCDAQKSVAKVVAPVSGVAVVVHKRIARLVFLLLAETERRGYDIRAGQTWGGNCRAIAGTQTPSNHSWWLAVDINSVANPYVVKKFGRPVTDMPAWLPLLWNAFGFAWGGDYSGAKADAMHLEFMGSPEDADDMTALAEQRLAPGLGGTSAGGLTPLIPEDVMTPTQELAVITRLDQLVNNVSALVNMVTGVPAATKVAVWAQPVYRDGQNISALQELADAKTLAAQVAGRPVAAAADVDEAAIVAGLRGSLAEAVQLGLAARTDEEVAAFARAAADEQDRRARERLAAQV